MNFIERIIQAGFVEQGQRRLLELMPHKERWIPRWWESYDASTGWLGVNVDHPDAWFCKDDKEVILSLQGLQMADPVKEEDKTLVQGLAARYLCLKAGGSKIYETFSGKLPPEEIINKFLQ